MIGLAAMTKAASAAEAPRLATPSDTAAISPRLRIAHGISAFATLLHFLGTHLSNHLAGLLSENVHQSLMNVFRTVYRARLIEPIVVGLFLFMIGSARHARLR